MKCIPQRSRRYQALVFGSRRTVETDLRAQWHALPPLLWLLINILMFVPDLAQSSQNKDRSVPIKLRDFLHEDITLAYSVFLGELLLGLFSVIGLFGSSDFLSLLAGISNRTRRTYLATSTLRTSNTASLLISEFR